MAPCGLAASPARSPAAWVCPGAGKRLYRARLCPWGTDVLRWNQSVTVQRSWPNTATANLTYLNWKKQLNTVSS